MGLYVGSECLMYNSTTALQRQANELGSARSTVHGDILLHMRGMCRTRKPTMLELTCHKNGKEKDGMISG